MTVNVRVVTGARKNEVFSIENGFKVYLNAPAVEGKANKALIEVLADYFKVKKSQVSIVKGLKGRRKIVEIV